MDPHSRGIVFRWVLGNLAWTVIVIVVTTLYRRIKRVAPAVMPTAVGVCLVMFAGGLATWNGLRIDGDDHIVAVPIFGSMMAICWILLILLVTVTDRIERRQGKPIPMRHVFQPIFIAVLLSGAAFLISFVVSITRNVLI